jgi:hypothetical protein
VGPRVGLNAVTKRNNPCSCWKSNHGRPAGSSVMKLTELSRVITAANTKGIAALCWLLRSVAPLFILLQQKGKVAPVLNSAPSNEYVLGRGGIDPRIL